MSKQKNKPIHLSCPGPILPGSISTAMSQCGKDLCSCKATNPVLHGPYYRWTGITDGKRTTITISPKIAKECQRRIQNYRKLLKALERIKKQSLVSAPWVQSDYD